MAGRPAPPASLPIVLPDPAGRPGGRGTALAFVNVVLVGRPGAAAIKRTAPQGGHPSGRVPPPAALQSPGGASSLTPPPRPRRITTTRGERGRACSAYGAAN